MAGLNRVPRPEKKRVSTEIYDNLVARATSGPPDSLLDPFIAKTATVRDAVGAQVEDKSAALAEKAALLAANDIDDDEVDRWYRHSYYYLEVELLRRHGPDAAGVEALLKTAYADGLSHVNDRIPEQNDQVRKTITAFRHPEVAGTLAAIAFPTVWLDSLDAAVQKSALSFAAYEAAMGDASTAVAMGRNAEDDWVLWARALTHAIALRSSGASVDVVEEGKRIIAPLTNAIRHLRTQAKARATKKQTP